MPIPTGNISNNIADIYSASLTYEKMGKCGSGVGEQSKILIMGDTWDYAVDGGAKGWKLVSLMDASTLGDLAVDNYSPADASKLISLTWSAGMEIMGGGSDPGSGITLVMVEEGAFILYKDCAQS